MLDTSYISKLTVCRWFFCLWHNDKFTSRPTHKVPRI